MKHALVTVLKNGQPSETFRVSATNDGQWKNVARPNGPVKTWQEEGRASSAACKVDFSVLPVNKLSDELPQVTVTF
jgi:hypothetical protein